MTDELNEALDRLEEKFSDNEIVSSTEPVVSRHSSQPSIGNMDDFVTCILGPENTERVVDRANDVAAWGALVFVEEDAPVVGVLDELLGVEIQVICEKHRFVLVGELQSRGVILPTSGCIVDGHSVDALALKSVGDDWGDVLVGEYSHARWRNFSESS